MRKNDIIILTLLAVASMLIGGAFEEVVGLLRAFMITLGISLICACLYSFKE